MIICHGIGLVRVGEVIATVVIVRHSVLAGLGRWNVDLRLPCSGGGAGIGMADPTNTLMCIGYSGLIYYYYY